MKQLICQLQRTTCTPRDEVAGYSGTLTGRSTVLGDITPFMRAAAQASGRVNGSVYSNVADTPVSVTIGMMREMLGSISYDPQQSELDPDCFEVRFV